MMKYLYILLFFGLGINVLSQNLMHTSNVMQSDTVDEITIETYGNYGSTFIDNKTFKLFTHGGFYADELKEEAIDKLRGNNYLGGEYTIKLEYQGYPKKLREYNLGIFAGYEVSGAFGINTSKDFFKTVFLGNNYSVGDTASLSPTAVNSFGFRKIGFGVIRDDRLKAGLGIYTFSNWTMGQINRGELFTAPTTYDMHLSLSADFMQGQAINPGVMTGNVGIGIGVDLEATSPFIPDSSQGDFPIFVLGVRNLGVVMLNENTEHFAIDSIYNFNGFEQTNFGFSNSDSTISNLVDSLSPSITEERKLEMLPAEVYFYAPSDPKGKKIQITYGFRYRIKSGMQPQAKFGVDYRPNQSFIASTFLEAGGYNTLRWGMAIRKDWNKFSYGIILNTIPGLFFKEAYGKSAGISLNYKL